MADEHTFKDADGNVLATLDSSGVIDPLAGCKAPSPWKGGSFEVVSLGFAAPLHPTITFGDAIFTVSVEGEISPINWAEVERLASQDAKAWWSDRTVWAICKALLKAREGGGNG